MNLWVWSKLNAQQIFILLRGCKLKPLNIKTFKIVFKIGILCRTISFLCLIESDCCCFTQVFNDIFQFKFATLLFLFALPFLYFLTPFFSSFISNWNFFQFSIYPFISLLSMHSPSILLRVTLDIITPIPELLKFNINK